MKLYRVAYYNHSDSSQGFSFHSSKKDATKELGDFKKQEGDNFDDDRSCVDELTGIKPTKAGILDLLRTVAGHPDNG